MKKFSVLRGSAGNTLGFLLITVVSLHPAPAQDVARNQILQNKTDEQDVRLHTDTVVSEIQSLIDELTTNGISGDDIKVLSATQAALTHLSGPEMERVISSLQKAGEAANPSLRQENVIDAYAGQKEIILQFRQILKDYEQRQAAYELPVRFKDLAKRQTDILMTSASVARDTAGKSVAELTGMQRTTEQIVQVDQEAIANEVNLAKEQLNKAAQGSTENDAANMRQAQKDMESGVLQQALSHANDALKAGQLLKAITEQKTARDELRQIAQDLNPPATAVDALTATAATLAKLIGEQKNLLDQTNAAADVKPRTTGLDEKQGALVDEANSLQQDMQSLSAPVSGLVKDAIDPMQASRAALGQQWGGPETFTRAANSQQEAISKLEEAQKQLEQQLADARKAAADATQDPVAKLQDLRKQIQTAMQQQQKLNNQTAQALNNPNNSAKPDASAIAQAQQQQSQIEQQTSAMQQTAQPLSLAASQTLAKAASQMNQAQQNLTDPSKAADAQAAQQGAQAALAQADQQVGQQIAQAQQQAPNPSSLAAAADSLQQAQSSVSTAIAAATPSPSASSPPNMPAASAALAAAAKHTQAAANTPGLPGSAAAAVKQAQTAIAQGQQQAAKNDAPGTANSASAAQQALAQAQAALAMTQAGLGPDAPEPITPLGHPDSGSPGTVPASPASLGYNWKFGAKTVSGGNTDKGTLHDTTGNGKFVTVASRDRAAIEQTQAEKRPQEYAPMIDQYMKNLADQSSSTPP